MRNVSVRPGGWSERPGTRQELVPGVKYVAGNAFALLIGLVVAYVALGGGAGLSIKIHDFMEYYSASHLLLTGHAGAIYNFAALGHAQAQLAYPMWPGNSVLPFLYPPYFATALVPLAALPYQLAYGIWLVGNCFLLAFVLYALESYAGLTGRASLFFRVGTMCSLPVFLAVGLGQVSMVLLALFALSFLAARSGHDVLAGICLGLALIKPVYALPLLLVFLVRRRWIVVGTFALSLAVLVGIPTILFGFGINRGYVRALLDVSGWQGQSAAVTVNHVVVAPATYTAQWNNSFAGLTELLLSPRLAAVVTAGLAAVVCALVMWYARGDHPLDHALGLAVIAGVLISPHTLAYDLALVIIPVAVILRVRSQRLWPLIALLFTLYVCITVGYRLAFAEPIQLSVLGMTLLFGWLCVASSELHSPSYGNRSGSRPCEPTPAS